MREEVDFPIRYYGRISSTQDIAKELVSSEVKVGTVIVADEQEHGRGRFGRTWLSPKGGLYASLILDSSPLLPLHVGIAVAEALRAVGINAMLKWPNDVLVGEEKIAGILIEIVGERAIVGIGVNHAANPMETATSVAQETSIEVSRDDLLELILQRFTSTPPDTILDRYRALSATIGQAVRVDVAGSAGPGPIVGKAVGLDSTGRLVVATGEAIYPVTSGECIHLKVIQENKQPHGN
jgi:BirA family biotin operon repressor/biotin-[acetyl-CoA-carboxylase] ligase